MKRSIVPIVPQACEDATTPEACAAITDDYLTCAWYETTSIADPVACKRQASTGVCLLSEQADGCTGAKSGCAASLDSVFVREGPAGGFEIVLDGPYCLDGIGAFQPCEHARDGSERARPGLRVRLHDAALTPSRLLEAARNMRRS